MNKQPNFTQTLEELDAGIFASRVSKALSEVALGVIEHGKKGKVTLTLDLERIGESAQCNVSHKVTYLKPTLRGKISEEATTVTPMHVSRTGHLSIVPEHQTDLFRTPKTENKQ